MSTGTLNTAQRTLGERKQWMVLAFRETGAPLTPGTATSPCVPGTTRLMTVPRPAPRERTTR